MLKDVGAMEQIFTASSLASVLSEQVWKASSNLDTISPDVQESIQIVT